MNESNESKPREGYPVIRYHDSGTQVLIGDHVEFKVGFLFWQDWKKGRVHYVPGLSKEDETLEHNRLMMVGIHDATGKRSGHIVELGSNRLRDNVRFIERAEKNNSQMREHIHGEKDNSRR